MGRALSIRVRIYLLLAIPLVTVAALEAFVVATTVGNAINLDRAPSLINAVSVPTATFDTYVQDERQAALVYLADPSAANRAQLITAQDATVRALPALTAKLTSPATIGNATSGVAAAIHTLLRDAGTLPKVRQAVDSRSISAGAAFSAYNGILTDELQLYLQEVASLTNAHAAAQALANVDLVQAREYLLQEDALLSAALAAHHITPEVRVEFTQLVGARMAAYASGVAGLDPVNRAAFTGPLHRYAPASTLVALSDLEGTVAASHGTRPPVSTAQWQPVATAAAQGYFAGGVNTAEVQVSYDRRITSAAWLRVALAGGLGLLGLAASVIVSGLAGRRIIRRLNRLGASALLLADEQLPDVVARLRQGEEVDDALAAPPMRLGNDEIGRVGQAFEAARRTAITAAVDEARLRRGINEVFRNLARRSQSLLHRQLAVLDGMERRTTDPAVLEDLFRLDHLTTRMRRHAEGLIILSGAPPGRGWSHPVRLVDVLRGAVAEVEDYARVSVVCASHASLAGPAVADLIHLLAELIENATTLSPPYTTVRVTGELVAKGFVVEVEDRGLGLSEGRLRELNARLADPPEFSLSNSEQLGLFVVGQLARRHGIQVTLRPSPYGGTTAITLVPADLVVIGDDYAGGLPAGSAAVWAPGRHTTAGETPALTGAPGPRLSVNPVQGALTQAPVSPVAEPYTTAMARGEGHGGDGHSVFRMAGAGTDVFHPSGRYQVRGDGGPDGEPADPPAPTGQPARDLGWDMPAPAVQDRVTPGRPVPAAPDRAAPEVPVQDGFSQPGDGDGYPPLPRRVRQASLAPALRDTEPPARPAAPADEGGDTGAGRSPEEIRAAMSAMQRGWERARAPWEDAPPPPGIGEWEATGGSGTSPGQRPVAGDGPAAR